MIRDFCVVYRRATGAIEWRSGSPANFHGCEIVSSGPGDPKQIVERYRSYGAVPGVPFPGETSFALWDREAHVLVCSRDLFGLRNLYFREAPESFAFSSRIAPLGPKEFDPRGLSGFLSGSPLAASTCFRGIRTVTPACTVLVREGSLRVFGREKAMPASADEFRDRLASSVQAAVPEERFACALSGGIDSGLVLALAGKRARAYTLAPRNPAYSEVAAAQRTAAHLRVQSILVPADDEDLVAALPRAVAAVEAPLLNLHAVAKFLLCRAVAGDGLRILLGGEGADELFGEVTPVVPDLELAPVLKRGFDLESTGSASRLEAAFPVLLLRMVDAVASNAGVEARLPFLDPRLKGVSDALSSDRRHNKRLVRELAQKMLPPEIARRPKRPMLTPSVDFFARYLTDDAIERCGVFRSWEVYALYERYRRTPDDPKLDRALMRIVTTLLLHDQLIAPCAG